MVQLLPSEGLIRHVLSWLPASHQGAGVGQRPWGAVPSTCQSLRVSEFPASESRCQREARSSWNLWSSAGVALCGTCPGGCPF